MKIRWTNNSVRFRITPGELESLKHHQPISEVMEWGNGSWEAYLSVSDKTSFWIEKMMMQVSLAPHDVEALAKPENEGVYFSTKAGPEGEAIRYFIEKDFPCAHPRASEAEESSETFEPPLGFEARKQQAKPEN